MPIAWVWPEPEVGLLKNKIKYARSTVEAIAYMKAMKIQAFAYYICPRTFFSRMALGPKKIVFAYGTAATTWYQA